MPGPSTTAVHGGARPDPDGALAPLLQRTSTFRYPELPDGTRAPYIYGRYDNPTVEGVEATLAALEDARHALLFASGLGAATAAVHALVPPGGTIAIQGGIYGGTVALLQEEFVPAGIHLRVLPPVATPEGLEGVDLLWMESITNPLLRVADVAAWARAVHAAGGRLLVDATFATPVQQRPLRLGADVVLHSATKYLGGHSDLLAGALVTDDEALRRSLWRRRRNLGAILDPETAWLLRRGLATLALRVARQAANAAAVAAAAAAHPAVVRVHQPGRPDHPDHATAQRVLSGAGGMVTLELGSLTDAQTFRRAVRLVVPAASLGGVESLVSLPLETSHAYADPDARRADGVGDGLVRLSCGIEDPEDLVADVVQALDACV